MARARAHAGRGDGVVGDAVVGEVVEAARRGGRGSLVLGALAVWTCLANVSIARDYQLGGEQVTTFRDPSR